MQQSRGRQGQRAVSSWQLEREFGDVIPFHGSIDTQLTLPLGTTEDVRNGVLHTIYGTVLETAG